MISVERAEPEARARERVEPRHRPVPAGRLALAALFLCCALGLGGIALAELREGIAPRIGPVARDQFNFVFEAFGLLMIAVAALELGRRSWRNRDAAEGMRHRHGFDRWFVW